MLYFLIRLCLPDTGSQLWAGGLCALSVLMYFVSNPKDEVTRLVYTTRKTGVCHSCSHGGCHFELHICSFFGKYFLGMGGFRTTNASEPISDDLFGYLRMLFENSQLYY